MVYGWICFLFNELCIFNPRAVASYVACHKKIFIITKLKISRLNAKTPFIISTVFFSNPFKRHRNGI